MKQFPEDHISMYLSPFEIFFRHWSVEVGLRCQDTERISVILAAINSSPFANKTDFCKQIDKLYKFIDSIKLIEKLETFASSLTIHGTFLINYMKMLEILILFIQSSRQFSWELHLASLHDFIKYFHAYTIN